VRFFIIFFLILLFIPITSYGQDQVESVDKDDLNEKGLQLLQQRRYEESIVYFDQVLRIDPNNISALANKATSLSELGNHEESLRLLETALNVNPNNIEILSNKGAVLFNLGNINESIIVLEKILEIEPKNVKILLVKANILGSAEKYNDAIEIYEKILEIEPENTFAQYMLNRNRGSTELISMKNSKYFGYVQIEVRNSNRVLVSVTESDTLHYLPFAITDEFLNESEVDNIVSMNGKNYEIYKLEETFHPEEDTFIGMVTLGTDKIGYDINVFSSFHHGFTLERGDVAISHWTILRQVT